MSAFEYLSLLLAQVTYQLSDNFHVSLPANAVLTVTVCFETNPFI